MRKQDYLIQLIQSLNMSEKRYFKLYSGLQQGEKKFMQLYQVLEHKADYNAPALCQELKISAGQLTKQKQYLSQELLSCLRNYVGQQAEIIALHNVRTDGRILIGKRLYGYALDITEKAIARAWELEQFELLLSLLANKYSCHFNSGQDNEMRQIADSRQKLALILGEAAELDYLDAETQRLSEKQNSESEFKKLLQHPLLKAKPEKLLSLRAKAGWFRAANNAYQCLLPGSKTLLTICREQKLLYENNPSLKSFYAYAYYKSFVSLAQAESSVHNFMQALAIYNELEHLIDSNELPVSKVRSTSLKAYIYVARMVAFCNLGQFEKVLLEENKLQPLIANRPVYEQVEAAITLAIAYVHLQRSHLALDKLNQLQEIDIPEKPAHLKTLRPLLIIAQIDLENYQLTPYLVKSAKAWMKRNKYVAPEYDTFFSLILVVANPSKNTTRRKAYAALMKAVKEGKMKELTASIYLERWIENKMNLFPNSNKMVG